MMINFLAGLLVLEPDLEEVEEVAVSVITDLVAATKGIVCFQVWILSTSAECLIAAATV